MEWFCNSVALIFFCICCYSRPYLDLGDQHIDIIFCICFSLFASFNKWKGYPTFVLMLLIKAQQKHAWSEIVQHEETWSSRYDLYKNYFKMCKRFEGSLIIVLPPQRILYTIAPCIWFLAHLNWRLMWAFLGTICLAVVHRCRQSHKLFTFSSSSPEPVG